jgi:two-component system CheB/CheR fusion protein
MLRRKLAGEASTQYEVRLFAKGRQRLVALEVNSRLLFSKVGKPAGIHAIARDVTERKEAEARQLVLIRELQHRAKNLLAVMQSITTNTLARSHDVQSANEAILGRLQALAHAQDFVVSGDSGGVPLHDLVEAELSGFPGRTSIDGIPIVVGGVFAQQFALVLHELATNAAKYGALSNPDGKVGVSWSINRAEDAVVAFSWVERDGPPVSAPTQEGFGTKLISATLNGTSHLSFAEHGLEFRVEVPMSDIMKTSKIN